VSSWGTGLSAGMHLGQSGEIPGWWECSKQPGLCWTVALLKFPPGL